MRGETEPAARYAFLERHSQKSWDDLILKLSESIHPVDREATRIWFAFWPLKLAEGIAETDDLEALVRDWCLVGNYRLAEQLDSSVEFLWGAHFWRQVKEAVLEFAESMRETSSPDTESLIHQTAGVAASRSGQEASALLGITAVGFMALRQIGLADFARLSERPSTRQGKPIAPDKLVKRRLRSSRKGLFGFLRTVDRKFRVVFDENSQRNRSFYAIHGQDLSMASASDKRDYTAFDPRRLEGPVPFECRSGSCGTCWVGVLAGQDRLAEISEFELKRLRYFGYVGHESPSETHPPIRLACQSQCFGDLSVVIPPWNGALKGRE